MRIRTGWILGMVALAVAGLVAGCYSSGDDEEKAPPVIVLHDTGGGGTGGGDTGMPTDTGGGQSCNAGLEKCGGSCVNVNNNASHCGQCGNSCGDQPCDNGQCVTQPEDCTQPGASCRGFTYCDLGSGECKPGCGSDDQCGPNSSCDIGSRDCSCDEGFHECNGQCVSNSSPNSCGASCTPCPSDPNGSATCAAGSCGLSCQQGYRNCGGQCASCPNTGPGATTTCNGSQCVTACQSGYITCSSGCCPANIETIDNTRTTDKGLGGVAVDSQGVPHVIYMSEPSNGNGQRVLKHAWRQQGSWTSQTIKVGGNTVDAGYSSWRVDIDSQDNLYTYTDDFGLTLLYQQNGSWKSQDVPNGGDGVGLVVDALDNAHIVSRGRNNTYYYARWDGSSWTDQVINPDDEFDDVNLAVDSMGTPHLAAIERSFDYLYYATKPSQGNWSIEKVGETVVQEPISPRIVADSTNVPHVFFIEEDNRELYEAVPGSGMWQLTSIQQPTGGYGRILPMEGRFSGRPMAIAYIRDREVFYGRKNGGSWSFENGSAVGDVNRSRSKFFVEPNGDPHFVWQDRSADAIKYAH